MKQLVLLSSLLPAHTYASVHIPQPTVRALTPSLSDSRGRLGPWLFIFKGNNNKASMKQARWGRKEMMLPLYLYIQEQVSPLRSCHSGETAQTRTGANGYQKEPTAASSRPSRSPFSPARQLSRRALLLHKPVTRPQVRSAQQQHQAL